MAYQLSLLDIKTVDCEAQIPLSNNDLYAKVARIANIPENVLNRRSEIGEAKAMHSPIKRKIRWFQQTLRAMGVIEKVDGRRGVWGLANKNKKGLHEAVPTFKLVAYSTKLGVSLWAQNKSIFAKLDEPIHLCLTSPPYPLRNQRAYGNVSESLWVDFITEALEPIVKKLVAGGSVVLNVSNDIFERKRPSRSLYLERMVLALHDRLGLSLMDRIPWVNYSKPPGPTYWSCVKPIQLCSAWEPVYWFTNDPDNVRSNNRTVLQEHTERQIKLMDNGGELRTTSYGDGAYRLKNGKSFSEKTRGKIPKNVFQKGHACRDTLQLREHAKRLGLPVHPAMFPSALPEFVIQFLTKKEDLVVDLFAGSNKVGLAAERSGRRWLSCDFILEYVRGQAEMFRSMEGFWINPLLEG